MVKTETIVSLANLLSQTPNLFILSWNDENDFFCSENFIQLTGYNSNEIANLPNKHISLLSENSKAKLYTELVNSFNDNSIQKKSFTYQIKSNNDNKIWLKETPLNKNNGYYLSFVEDISALKEKEINQIEELRNKTKLNDSKDKLISIIAHDLRAPFTSLLGFSEILLNEPNLAEDERKEYLQYIYDASKLQLDLVNHLLDWTRLQTGTMKFEPQRLEIKDIIDNCVSVLTGTAIRKEIEIKVDAPKDVFVNADEKLISQVVTNLLSNAVKFTPSGKSIFIKVNQFKDNLIEIVVEDEGQGISDKNKSKLFNIESKFSQTGTAGEKGSGLGLTLVKEIIEKHNGEIWFYSELGKGSEFHFTLPKSDNNIIIVEEHEDIQNYYKDILNKRMPEYKIIFAKNGFEALNLILKNIPSALITYHTMPLMNGIQLVSSLRKKDKHKKVDVIILADELSDEENLKYKELSVIKFAKVNSSVDELVNMLIN